MLLNFTFENVRSFCNQTEVSMEAAPLRTKVDRLIKVNKKKYLPAAVIYGPNAGGKSNLMKAFRFFRDIVLSGKIRSADNEKMRSIYDHLSFFHDYECYQKPTSFSIEFITDYKDESFRVEYELKVDSRVLDKEPIRRVLYERLVVDGNEIFIREEKKLDLIPDMSMFDAKDKAEIDKLYNFLIDRAGENLNVAELFLTNGYRNIVGSGMAEMVTDWFQHQLVILDETSKVQLEVSPEDFGDQDAMLIQAGGWDGILKTIDTGLSDISYFVQKENSDSRTLIAEYEMKGRPQGKIVLPAKHFESLGTRKFLEISPAFFRALATGAFLLIDELDTSLHPEIAAGILSVFNDPEINTKGAQLVFTTHNPVYLNQKLLRRDQMWFADKDPQTHMSELYRLSDYGSEVVRNDTDIYMHYLMGDYGALPVVDMREAFRQALPEFEAAEQGVQTDAE